MPDRPTRQWIAALTLTLLIASTACRGTATPEQTTQPNTTTQPTAPEPTTTPTTVPEATTTPTPHTAQEELSAPADAIDDAEAEVENRLFARRDLEVTATATPRDDDSFLIDAAMRVLDHPNVFDPTLIFTPSAAVQIIDLPTECTTTGTEVTCVLAVYFDQDTLSDGRIYPTDWLPLTIAATINPDTPEPHQITITAISDGNGLDNDPDPTNNVVTLELSS